MSKREEVDKTIEKTTMRGIEGKRIFLNTIGHLTRREMYRDFGKTVAKLDASEQRGKGA